MRITRYEAKAAARTLLRHRGFTTVAVLSLGIAIGLNTTMYSALDALINPRVDWREPQQLYSVGFYGDFRHRIDAKTRNAMLRSVADFEAVTGWWLGDHDALLESDVAHRLGSVGVVAPNYFSVHGARALRGRLINETDVGATTPAIVLAERAARDLFPDKQDPVGKRIEVQGVAYTVVGVATRRSASPLSAIVAWRLPDNGVDLTAPMVNIVRLRPGLTVNDVLPPLNVIAARIATQVGEPVKENRVVLGSSFGGQRHFAVFQLAVIGAVIAVLLVACANIANLQLARGIARGRELATRAALGASRRDLITHLMFESTLIAAAGLALGLVLTFWGMAMIRASIPPTIGEFIVEPQTSWRLFAVAAVATALCIVLVGLVPAMRVSRVNLNDLIKSGAGTGSTRAARRQYGLLIIAEIGFALVVSCAAALLVRASYRLDNQSQAWDRSKLTGALTQVSLPAGTAAPFGELSAELVTRLRTLPDIADAAVVLRAGDPDRVVTATDPGGAIHTVPAPMWGYSVVTPSYFRTMGFEIAHGRDFREGETGPVAIVDPRTARLMWPNTEAVGHMIKFGAPGTPGRWYTVIGVRAPIGVESTMGNITTPGTVVVLATPENQLHGNANARPDQRPAVDLVVRSRRNAHRAAVTIKNALANDARFNIYFAGTFDQRDGTEVRRVNQRFVGGLFALFASLAFALAVLGVFGIVSHSVAERKRELGVRLALGSSAREIVYVVLREGNVFVLGGVAVGLVLIRQNAWMLTQFIGGNPEIDLYSVELYAPAAALFFIAAVLSALVPALRAARIDPVESLRCE